MGPGLSPAGALPLSPSHSLPLELSQAGWAARLLPCGGNKPLPQPYNPYPSPTTPTPHPPPGLLGAAPASRLPSLQLPRCLPILPLPSRSLLPLPVPSVLPNRGSGADFCGCSSASSLLPGLLLSSLPRAAAAARHRGAAPGGAVSTGLRLRSPEGLFAFLSFIYLYYYRGFLLLLLLLPPPPALPVSFSRGCGARPRRWRLGVRGGRGGDEATVEALKASGWAPGAFLPPPGC